jgi:hypothetical protein
LVPVLVGNLVWARDYTRDENLDNLKFFPYHSIPANNFTKQPKSYQKLLPWNVEVSILLRWTLKAEFGAGE